MPRYFNVTVTATFTKYLELREIEAETEDEALAIAEEEARNVSGHSWEDEYELLDIISLDADEVSLEDAANPPEDTP